MKKTYIAVCAIALAAILAGCGKGPSSGKVLVTVNGEKITEGDLDFLSQINPRIQSQLASPEGKQRILDNLVEQDLLYQEAVKEGVNRDADVKAKIDLYRRVIIAQSLVEKDMEKAAKKYYDEHQDEFKKLKLSDILVKFATPDQLKAAAKGKETMRSEDAALKLATELKDRIDKGEGFEGVAKEASEDPLTKARGGDLGLVSQDDKRMMARGYGPLLEKAYQMKVGEVAGPIKTQDGYHVITVTRGVEVEPFEEAKMNILFKVRGDSRQELLARLKKDAKIVYAEEAGAKKGAEEGAAGATPPAAEAQPPAAGEQPASGAVKTVPPGSQQIVIPGATKTGEAQATPAAKAPAAKKAEPAKKK